MDFLKLNKNEINKINIEVNKLTNFEDEQNPYHEFVPMKYGERQKDAADASVKKAIRENELIGYAIENSKQFKLSDIQKSKLKSMKGRNLAHMLLNSRRFKKDSDKMQRVKETVEAVEIMLVTPIWQNIAPGGTSRAVGLKRAMALEDAAFKYQDAIVACRAYLGDREPSSPKGIERYQLVRATMNNMIDEMNKLSFAKQMVFRGKMGANAECVKDLIVDSQRYMNESGSYTEAEKEEMEKSGSSYKNYDYFSFSISMMEEENMAGEMRLFYDAVNLKVPADILVKNYGQNAKDKKFARDFLMNVRNMLASFKEGEKNCCSFIVGENIVNIFQKEDGTLDLGYNYVDGEGQKHTRVRNLNISASDLVHKLGINMVENEKIFGVENTKKIMLETENITNETTDLKKSRYAEIAAAYLRTRLGIPNIKLTNIPSKEIVRIAKRMEGGRLSSAQALKRINDYEYGDKNAKKVEKRTKLQELKNKRNQLNESARQEGFRSIESMEKQFKQKEELDKFSKEENERALKNAQNQAQNQNQAQGQEQVQGQAQNQVQGQNQVQNQVQGQNQNQAQGQNQNQENEPQQVQNAQPVNQQVNAQENQVENQQVNAQENQVVNQQVNAQENQVVNQQVNAQENQVENQQVNAQENQVVNQQVNVQENAHANQEQQPDIEFPEEAILYEQSLNIREQGIRNEAESLKDEAMQKREERLWELGYRKEQLTARMNKFLEQAQREKDFEADQLVKRANYATEYMEGHAAKIDVLRKKYEEDVKKAREENKDNEELFEAEEKWLFKELERNIHELSEESSRHLAEWNERQDLKLRRRTERIDRRTREASDALIAVNLQIDQENLKYETEALKADTQMESKLSELNLIRGKFNQWKDYYRREKTRDLGAVLGDFQVVENDQQIHPLENMPLNFWEWKAAIEKDVKKRADEQKAAEETKKLHNKLVEDYRDVKADYDELKSADLETITDIKVNGEDTLELLRIRDKSIEDGTLKTKVVYTDEYEEEKDLKEQTEKEKKRIEAGGNIYRAKEQLDSVIEKRDKRVREIEKKKEENKKKRAELTLEQSQLQAPIKEVFHPVPKEKEEAIEKVFADRLKMQNDAEAAYALELQKLEEKVKTGKIKEETAAKRKDELSREFTRMTDLRNGVLSSLIDELDETVDEKLRLSDEYDRTAMQIREQIQSKALSQKKGETALNEAFADYEAKLHELNENVKKSRSQKVNEEREKFEKRRDEIAINLVSLQDDDDLLDEEKEKLNTSVDSIRKVKEDYEEIRRQLDVEIEQIKQRRQERENRIKQEIKPSEWSYEEQQLLDVVAEIIYSQDTWDMDNETQPGMRLFNIVKKYGDVIGKWMGDVKKTKQLLNTFADKLPLSMFDIDKAFITEDVFEYLEKARELAIPLLRQEQAAARERENGREQLRNAKRGQFEQEKQKRSEKWANDKQVIADLKEEEEDRRQAEQDERALKALEEGQRLDYNQEHLDAIAELEKQLDKEEAERIEKQRKEQERLQAKVKSFFSFSWLGGGDDDEEEEKQEDKVEEKKEEKEEEKKQEEKKEEENIDPQIREREQKRNDEIEKIKERQKAREERKKAREERKAQRDAQDAIEDAKWAKEIEDAGKDDDSFIDNMLLTMSDDYLITFGTKHALENKDGADLNEKLQEAADIQKELEVKVHKLLRGAKAEMEKYINKNMGEAVQPEPIEQVPYYKEQGIEDEERQRRIDLGKAQLTKMVNNSMKGNDGEGQFVRNVLSTYVADSSILDVRSMFASAIRNAKPVNLPEDATEEQKNKAIAPMVGGLFKGAGPLLQKILQGIPDSMIPDGMQDAFDDMKSNLAPIPRPIVEAQLLSMVQRSNGRIERIEVTRSLGAASVGQAFLCKVYTRNSPTPSEVVIKLLRPDVRNRMLREKKIMQKCAAKAGKGMAKTYDGLLTRYMEELDLTIEAANCERGRIYDDNENNVESMKVSSLANPTPNAMMVNRAYGDTVINVLKKSRKDRDDIVGKFYKKDEEGKLIMEGENPKIFVSNGADVQNIIADLSRKLDTLQRQQQMLCKLSEKWVTEAVFGEGYYHGDLHSGNIMLDSHRLTVIDFGNATKLDKFQQEKITMMLMAAAAGSGSGFMEGFTALLGEDSIKLLETKKDELQAVFSEVMKLGDYHSSAERIAAALVRAQKLGFELPPAIYGFQQCQIRLMNTLDSFNKEVIEMQKILRQLQAAQNATILDVKSEFDKTVNEDAGAAGNMKIAVLSDKEEDLRPLLKSRNEGVRKSLENIFHEDFDSLATLLSQDPSTLIDSTLSSERQIKQQYGIVGSNFFDISKFYQVLTDHGFNMQNDGRSPQQQVQDYAAHFNEIPYEEKLGIATEILHIYSEFDILGALRALWKAQDEGKNEEELKALEDIVIQRIGHTRQGYLERAEPQLVARIEDLYDGVEADDLAQMKQRDKEKGESYYNLDKIFANVKTKLRVPANLPQAEEELKPFFADPIYGQRLKEAFDAYKAAPADAPNKEELLNNFVEAYRMPVFISFGESRKGSAMFAINYNDPKTFVDVMGDVIDVKYKEALKRVSFFKSVKYGFRIQGDIEKRNLTTTEFIKMMWNRMRGND